MLNTAEKPGGPQSFEIGISVGDGNMKFTSEDSKALLRHDIEIAKSESDNRLYLAVTLRNQLKVLLISDPQTDKAAACLAVGVGSFSDPADVPGLAHFCEHMILLGSQKYPGENEYSKFITSHNGYCNAFTSTTETCYVFDIVPEYLYEALERFSELFVAPLFTESATEREIMKITKPSFLREPANKRTFCLYQVSRLSDLYVTLFRLMLLIQSTRKIWPSTIAVSCKLIKLWLHQSTIMLNLPPVIRKRSLTLSRRIQGTFVMNLLSFMKIFTPPISWL